MKWGRFLPVCKLSLAALASALVIAGCSGSGQKSAFSTKLNDRHPSSQRAFLEKLVVSPESLEEENLRLREKWFVAHNGYGQIDIGGLLNGLKDQALAQKKNEADTVTVAGQEVAAMALGQISEKALAVLPEVAPSENDTGNIAADEGVPEVADTDGEVTTINLTEVPTEETDVVEFDEAKEVSRSEIWRRMDDDHIDDMISRVRPKGNLEGYGQVVYTCIGKDMQPVTVQYYLSNYPVDYLRDSEVSASVNSSSHEGGDKVTEEDTSQERIPFELKELDQQNNLCGYALLFGGLEIHLRAEKGNEKILQRCADLLAERIDREIEINHSVIAELREQGRDTGPGKVGLSGVWGHLSRHIDLEQKEYQPIRRKF